jgi:hypothetical protein
MVSTLGFEPKDVGSNPAGTAKHGKVAQQVEQAVEARCLRGFDSYPFHKSFGGFEQRQLISFIS